MPAADESAGKVAEEGQGNVAAARIVDRVLRRDMTALFGVRRVLELEQTFQVWQPGRETSRAEVR